MYQLVRSRINWSIFLSISEINQTSHSFSVWTWLIVEPKCQCKFIDIFNYQVWAIALENRNGIDERLINNITWYLEKLQLFISTTQVRCTVSLMKIIICFGFPSGNGEINSTWWNMMVMNSSFSKWEFRYVKHILVLNTISIIKTL